MRASPPPSDLRALLPTLSPSAREHLRSVLIRDQADRDAIASDLLRYRDQTGDGWADIIDVLTMYPDRWGNRRRDSYIGRCRPDRRTRQPTTLRPSP